jgi:hypothetical protein
MLRMLLLACSAGYVAYVDYLSHGIQPLFAALLLGVTAWTGYFLWEDPDAGGPSPPGRGGGPDWPGRGGGPDGDTATTDRAGATRTAAEGARTGSDDPRTARGAQVREKVPADVE